LIGQRIRIARTPLVLALAAVGLASAPSRGEQPDPVLAKGVQFLQRAGAQSSGESALMALALIKAEVPANDPGLARHLAAVLKRFEGGNYTLQGGGAGIYEAGVTIMAFANLDAVTYRPEIESVAQYILSKQNANGSWDYEGRQPGDCSISQYAVLGLWEAENAGIAIPPSTWDRAAAFYLGAQRPAGGWNYHPDDPTPETLSMTAAGVGSLLICYRQLAPYRIKEQNLSPLLISLGNEGQMKRYTSEISQKRLEQSIRAGIGWLAANFSLQPPIVGPSPYYGIYGIERYGALAEQQLLGRVDWFVEGRKFLAANQRGDGAFSASFGEGPNTAWAVMFLTKSTAKTLRKIQLRRLGAGTLVGGRGLPRDLSTISIAGGKVVAKPMDGAIEGMLTALEDPRVEDASSALAGLLARYQTDGPRALRPYQGRFRKLLTDPDPGVRRVAAWALSRMSDMAMVPPLIDALKDPDDAVVTEARLGLQLLSRKIDGFGPAPGASPADRDEAIRRWKGWYEATRPIVADIDAADPSKASSDARRAP
jgi:hypothetical protein